MKPIVIIAIAVVCSVIVVFGVLFSYEMYSINQMQKAASFGAEVGNTYEQHISNISNCIPNKVSCYNHILKLFESDMKKLADSHGFDYNSETFQEYNQYAKNLLKIEYDYQNKIYDIDKFYVYDSERQSQIMAFWEKEMRKSRIYTEHGLDNQLGFRNAEKNNDD